MHIVFYNKKFDSYSAATESDDPKALVVFAVFVDSSRHFSHSFFDFTENLHFVKKADSVYLHHFEGLRFNSLIPLSGGYYTYEGSLTTPPCSEIVTWILLKDHLKISSKYMPLFRSILDHKSKPVKHNYRGLFKVNGRKIYSQSRDAFVDICNNEEFSMIA